jgi:vacuolar-type H+-ATPase subunit B/Vma2
LTHHPQIFIQKQKRFVYLHLEKQIPAFLIQESIVVIDEVNQFIRGNTLRCESSGGRRHRR